MEYYLPSTNRLCGSDDNMRTFFGNHMYVRSNGFVLDACAGPILGGLSKASYLNTVVDASTTNEWANSFRSPYYTLRDIAYPRRIPLMK